MVIVDVPTLLDISYVFEVACPTALDTGSIDAFTCSIVKDICVE